jgi:hypothetical protein
MNDTPERLAKRLIAEGEKTLAFFRSLPEDAWNQRVYTEGSSWSVIQVLAHFAAAENSLARLVAHILKGGEGTPQNFDLDAYNERKVGELQEIQESELMERFSTLRQETAALVARMGPDDLTRTGRHPWLGVAPLAEIVKLIYLHNGIHLRDVKRAITRVEGRS